jgi:hypothetical protein
MAAEYFLYNTNYNNTLIDRSDISFAPLPPDRGEIFIEYFIPNIQPLYYYRESGGTIVINDETTIENYLKGSASSPNTFDTVDFYQLTGYSATTNAEIEQVKEYAAYGIGTGAISGGTIVASSGDTTFDIEPAKLLFVDQYTNPDNPIINEIYYSGATGITPTFLTTRQATYISIDSDLNISQRDFLLSPSERRNEIALGIVIHNNLSTINDIDKNLQLATDIQQTTYDVLDTLNIVKFDQGNQLITIDGTLQIKKTAGDIFKRSSGYEDNIKSPNIKSLPEENPATVFYRDINGNTTSGRTEIITDEYELVDSGGTGSTIMSITGNPSQATVQRVFLFESGKIVIQRGQRVYRSLYNAFKSFLDEDYVYEFNTINDALLIGCIAIRLDCDDISNKSKAELIAADRYGNIIGASNAGYLERQNYQLIKKVDDFPNPDENGNIFLQDNFTYELNGNIDIGTNQIVLGNNNNLRGENYNTDILIGSGDTLIYASANTINIEEMGLYNINSTGNTIECSQDEESVEPAFIRNIRFLSQILGCLRKYNYILLQNVQGFNTKNGFIIEPTSGGTEFVLDTTIFTDLVSGGTLFTISGNTTDGIYDGITIQDSIFNLPSGTTGFNILPSSAMTTTFGTIRNNQFINDGGIPLTGGLTKGDRQWDFVDNLGLDNSVTFGYFIVIFNQNETTINATGTYYKANVVNDSSQVERFTTEGLNNRLTYSGRSNTTIDCEFIVTGGLEVDANSQSILAAVYKNGTTNLAEVEVIVESSGSNVAFTVVGVTDLNVGDYLELFVRNLSSTNNITVVDMQFKINELS